MHRTSETWRAPVRFVPLLPVLLLCAGCPAQAAPATAGAAPDTADIQEVLDGRLTPDREVRTFERSERLYPAATVPRRGPVSSLPRAAHALPSFFFTSKGQPYDLGDYLAEDRVAGLLVLKDGKVVLEDYELGLQPSTRWASWSMAKSVSSTLIGAALQQGWIGSLDDPAAQYVPALRNSVYSTVSIRDVLRMTSGVAWTETYTDPASDCRRLTEAQLRHRPGASMAFMATLKRASPPGTVWNYNSGESNIVGAILEGATHRPLAQYLAETLWGPLGMEHDASWWTESPGGMGLSGVGLGATLRDYARFGLFVAGDGSIDGRRVVPEGWFAQAGAPQRIGGEFVDYGYGWWPVPAGDPIGRGAFQAIGIFGQHMYINPAEKLVIVVLSARSKPVSSPPVADLDFFTAVAHRLHATATEASQ